MRREGSRACKSDGALGDDPLLEVLKCGGLHLVVTTEVPIGGGAVTVRVCARALGIVYGQDLALYKYFIIIKNQATTICSVPSKKKKKKKRREKALLLLLLLLYFFTFGVSQFLSDNLKNKTIYIYMSLDFCQTTLKYIFR